MKTFSIVTVPWWFHEPLNEAAYEPKLSWLDKELDNEEREWSINTYG